MIPIIQLRLSEEEAVVAAEAAQRLLAERVAAEAAPEELMPFLQGSTCLREQM
jgi:hypothetical protein